MTATKVDLKREFKSLYTAGLEPSLVEVPELTFLMIDGRGDPNTERVRRGDRGSVPRRLHPQVHSQARPAGLDYGVMPLEGLWWTPDLSTFATGRKSLREWTVMIVQPDEVTPDSSKRRGSRAPRRPRPRRSPGFVWSASRRGTPRSCTLARTRPRLPRSTGSTRSLPLRGTNGPGSTTRSTSAIPGALPLNG